MPNQSPTFLNFKYSLLPYLAFFPPPLSLSLCHAYQSSCIVVVQLDQCAQIAASLSLLGIEKGTWVAQSKVDIVTAAAPLPLTLRELDVVPELAPATPTAHAVPARRPAQQKLGYAVVEMLLLLLLHSLFLLLPLERCLRCGSVNHLRLSAIATHVWLVAGAFHQLPHGAGLGHGVRHARRSDGVHEARFTGVCWGVAGKESEGGKISNMNVKFKWMNCWGFRYW